jgi:hypothetical protein
VSKGIQPSPFGVYKVERLDALVVLSHEERKDSILVQPVVVTQDHKGGTSLC